MSQLPALHRRLYLTAWVLVAESLHLGWEFFNGGVRSHHLLARSDLPEFSNWWGILLLPALTWFAIGQVRKRTAGQSKQAGQADGSTSAPAVGLVTGIAVGVALSLAFRLDYSSVASYILLGTFVLALFLPVFRIECIVGFILGMTFTFGAVLPSIIGSLLAGVSALTYYCVRPALIWVVRRIVRARTTTSQSAS